MKSLRKLTTIIALVALTCAFAVCSNASSSDSSSGGSESGSTPTAISGKTYRGEMTSTVTGSASTIYVDFIFGNGSSMTMKKYSTNGYSSVDTTANGTYSISGSTITVSCASINASGSTTNNWSSIVFTTNSFNGTMNKQ